MNIGKKILSAFVEVSEEKQISPDDKKVSLASTQTKTYAPRMDRSRFKEYFDKLFAEANIPGPDYYEFSKMVEAMNSIADEKSRYVAAFAGLHVQGLDKEKLLQTAMQYLQVLETDAMNFHSTIDAAVEEKVQLKRKEIEEKQQHIRELSQEIGIMQEKINLLTKELKENEEKIQLSSTGYQTELENMKTDIQSSIEKIRQHIA